uniref:hAT-like transposase RNase-H fold domain-containing protein n=1 Tax=Oryza barthii TaxID=65489 RepID=A0A0D3GIA5_9ORYZ
MGERKNFERMIRNAFCPQYTQVSRKTTKNFIVSLYRSRLDELKRLFSIVSFSFVVTSDIWTSKHQRTSSSFSFCCSTNEGKFLKYFTTIPHLYCFALVLDPRKKLEVVEAAFISIGDAVGLDYSEAYQHARDELFRVFRLYQTKLSVAR